MAAAGPRPAPAVAVRRGAGGFAGQVVAPVRRPAIEAAQAAVDVPAGRAAEATALHGGPEAPGGGRLQTATALVPVGAAVG